MAHIAPHLRCFAVEARTLKRDTRNARSHTDHDLHATAASLKQFGQQELIQYEPRTRTIKVGNGRFEAATDPQYGLKWKYIAAVPSGLSGAQLQAFALAHNRTGERAGWLDDELDRQLAELADAEFNNDLLANLGFEKELERLAGEFDSTTETQSHGEGAEVEDGGSDTPDPPDRGRAMTLSDQFKIVLTCRDESHQTGLLEAMESNDAKALKSLLKDIPCRALIG